MIQDRTLSVLSVCGGRGNGKIKEKDLTLKIPKDSAKDSIETSES